MNASQLFQFILEVSGMLTFQNSRVKKSFNSFLDISKIVVCNDQIKHIFETKHWILNVIHSAYLDYGNMNIEIKG